MAPSYSLIQTTMETVMEPMLVNGKTTCGMAEAPTSPRTGAHPYTSVIGWPARKMAKGVRRHINWNTQRPDLREALVHLVGYIKRHFCGIASAGPSLF